MEYKKKDYMFYHKGPNGSIRFRVAVKDLVTFRNAYRVKKKLELEGQTIKKLDQEALGKIMRDVQGGHESMGVDGVGPGMFGMAQNMAGTGAGADEGGHVGALCMGP